MNSTHLSSNDVPEFLYEFGLRGTKVRWKKKKKSYNRNTSTRTVHYL